MDDIERARQLFYELEARQNRRPIEVAVRQFEITSRLAQKIQ